MANAIIETIAPEKAQVYLNKSGGNRNISQVVVDRYAKDMRDGNWKLNGVTIVFDVDGRLIDGHHRLHACIKAGVPFQTYVARGVGNDVFTTLDCGRHRNVAQLLTIKGVKNYNSVSSSMTIAYKLMNNQQSVGVNVSYKEKKTNMEMMEFFNQDPYGFAEAGNIAVHYANKARILHASIIGGVFYYLTHTGGYSNDFVKSFFDKLINLDPCDGCIDLLRRRLWSELQATRKTPRNIVFALLVKVWNSFVTGKPLKCLKFNPDVEDYPKFILNNNITTKN